MVYVPMWLVFIPILTAMLIFLFQYKKIVYLAFVAQAAITVLAVWYTIHFHDDFSQTAFVFGGWDSLIGIGFLNDAISISFLLLAIFLWWMVLIYTHDARKDNRQFLFFLLFLEGVFLALLQTNDLFNLFVFIELTTILVTILVAYEKGGESFRAAIYYLLVNTAGVLAFLMGIILLYYTFGNINITAIQQAIQAGDLDQTMTVRFAFVLLLAGIAVKSALFPLFTWLPRAHAVAKSGVSALLSGIVVKGGVYLFIRISLMFEGADYDTSAFFFIVGTATALVGVVFAMTQKDIKQILAYHTVSQIGIMMMGLSAMTGYAFYGGLLHVFNHALFKSLLFLGAGVIASVYKTKYVTHIRGVFKTMPVFSVLMIVGMLSITGAPLFNGFISKSVIKYDLNTTQYWLLQLVNLGTATSFVKMSQIFFGEKTVSYPIQRLREYVPMALLALACLVMGLFHVPIASWMLDKDLSYFSSISIRYVLEYALMLGGGYLVYRYALKKDAPVVRAIRSYTISFETANVLFLSYFALLIVFFVLWPMM